MENSGNTRTSNIKTSKNVEHHFNAELVGTFISFFEDEKYVEFMMLLPKKGRFNFMKDYYKINIKENKAYNLEYYNMYCHFSVENN